MKEEVQTTTWRELTGDHDMEASWPNFKVITKLLAKYVPKGTKKRKATRWMTEVVKRVLITKQNLWRTYKFTTNTIDY